MPGIKFDVTGDNKNVLESFRGVQEGVRKMKSSVEESGMSIEKMFNRIQTAAAASLAGFSVKEFISKVVQVRGEFQQLEVAFTTMLGSAEKANALMQQLTKTAAITPFDLQGVTNGAKQLLAYGIAAEDVNETLIHLGDIAAGLSIPLNDLVYLYGTTMVQGRMFTQDLRQFQGRGVPIAEELAKHFGVAKERIGEMVTAGKVGAKEFKQAIMDMSSEGGKFGGLMEKQSKTISGQISNIEDAIDVMFNNIGQSSEGLINDALSGVSTLVENYEAVGEAILAVAEAYGIYKAAMMASVAFDSAATNIGYDAEIAALQKVIPLKEEAAATDLEAAVASGRLTEEKAIEIATLRAEAEAHLENLKVIAAEDAAKAESAAQSLLLAQNRADEAQRSLNYYEKQYEKALEAGEGFAIETAEMEMNTAASNLNAASKELQTAKEVESAAASKASASAKAVETAQTNLDTASNAANTASTGILTQAKLALKRAIDAVNASFLGSPLFWIGAAITAVTFGVYKLATAMSDAEEANNKWNEQSREVRANIAAERAEIDRLFEKLRSAKEGTEQYKATKDAIINQYGKYLNGLGEEIRTLKDVEGAYKAVAKAAREAAIARGKEAALKDVQDAYGKKYSDTITWLQTALKTVASDNTVSKYLKVVQNELRITGTVSLDTEKKLRKLFDDKKGGLFSANAYRPKLGQYIQALRNNERQLNEYTKNVEERFKVEEEISQKKEVRDKKAIEQEKKNLTSELEALNAKDAAGKKGIEIKKKIQALDKELDAYDTSDKKSKQREKEVKQEDKYHQTIRKMRLQHSREIVDLQIATTQAEIDALKDGNEKTIRQLELNFAKQEEEIKRGYEDLKQKKIDEARQLWESNPANKGKTFNENTVNTEYTLQETENYKARLKANREEYLRNLSEISKAEMQSMYDYLKEYGSMQSRKLAIAREYAEKIAQEEDAFRKKSLEQEMQSAIDNMTAENLLKQIDLGAVFSEYGKLLASPLEHTIKQLEEYTQSNSFKSRSIEDQKSIFKAIEEAKKELGEISKVSFTKLGENLYEYNNALVAFNNASVEMESSAKGVIDTETALKTARDEAAKITSDATKTDEEKAEAEKAVTEAEKKAIEARNRYSETELAYGNAQARMVKAQQAAANSLSDLDNSIDSVGKIASAVASGSMKQFWDALGKKTQNRIGQFVAGSRQYDNAIKLMTTSLGDQGKGMDFFVEKIQTMTSEILSSGDEISESNLGQKISDLFGSIFGDNGSKLDAVQDKIGKAIGDILNNAKDTGEETDTTIKKAGDAAIQAITKSSGSIWALVVGLIFDLLDVLAEGVGTLVESILSKVGAAIEGVLTNIGSGKFFEQVATGVGNIVAGIIKGVGNLFSGGFAFGGSNEDEMEERINELAIANKALATSIDSLRDQIKKNDATNDMSIDAYQKAMQAELDWERNQREAIDDMASEWTNSGYGFLGLGGKSSFNYFMPENDWSGWKAFTEALKEHGYDRNVDRNNIWELTPEEMQILRDFRPSEWAALFSSDGHKNPQDLVNEYIERAGMLESLTSALNEKLTGYSWDGFLDAYKSLLKNLDSTTEDFAKHINELITNALVESFVNSAEIQDRIKALYAKIAAFASTDSAGGTTLTEEEIAEIRKDNEALASVMTAWRDAAKAAGLIVDSEEEVADVKEYFSTLRDSWLSTLTDMEADAESWNKEITRIMVEDLINSFVLNDDFDSWLEDWKNRYMAIVEDTTLSEEERERRLLALRDEQIKKREELAEKSKNIMDDMGYTDMMEEVEKIETGFENLHSKFLSTLMDMNADAETWSKEITKTMIEQLLERNVLNEAFDSKLDDWRTRFENVMADTTLSDAEREASLAALRAELEAMRESLSAEAQKFLDSLGYSEMVAEKAKSPFDNVRQQFLSTLMDMNSDAEDFRDSLNKTLTQSLIERFVLNDEFDKYLEDWNQRYMDILNDGNRTQEEIEAALDAMIAELIQKREMTLEQAEKLRERLQEVAEEDTTFKSMADNWISVLMDMDSTAEDWSREIGKTMARKIIEQMVSATMIQPLLDQLQDAFNKIMSEEGATWQSAVQALSPEIDKLKVAFDDLQPIVQEILNALGIFKEEVEEIVESDTSFKDLTDSWISTLMDMEKTADDWAQSIGQTMARRIIEEMIAPTMLQPFLDAIQATFDSSIASGKSITEVIALLAPELSKMKDAFDDVRPIVEQILDSFGLIKEEIVEIEEEVGDTTFKDLASNWASTLMDMDATADDWAQSVGKMMAQRIIEEILAVRMIQPILDQIQATVDAALDAPGATWQSAVAAMAPYMSQLKDAFTEAQPIVEQILNAFGIFKEEVVEEAKEGFSDLRGAFVSSLMDMEADAEKFGRDIARTMTEQMIDKLIEKQFGSQLDALNEAWYNALEAGDTAAMERIRQQLIELQKLCGEAVQPLLDTLAQIEYVPEEVEEEVDETITSMRDGFLSALMDMKSGTQDFVNDIRKLLTQKLVEKFVLNAQFDAWLQNIQNQYDSIYNSGMNEAEMAAAMDRLATEWELKAKEMQLQTQRIFDLTGWSDVVEKMNSPLADLRSTIRSALLDIESDTQDFADDISKILTEAFIDKFILGDEFEKKLEEWQEQYAAIMKGNYSEEERALLLKNLQDAITAAKEGYAEESRIIQELMGTGRTADQQATMNMADKAAYDQFETYLGIAVAQQMATIQGNEVRIEILNTLKAMTGITSPNGDMVKEIRTMLGTTNEYLLDIKRSNRDILNQFGAKLDRIISKLTDVL